MLAVLRDTGLSLRDSVRRMVRAVRRTQPAPALLRLIAGLAALAALATASPGTVVHSSQVGLFVPVAIGVGLFPRTRWVGLTAITAILLWLITTIANDSAPPMWRLGLLACALYLMHSAAALAAVVPYDASVAREVLLRWGRRVGGILAVSVALGLGGMALAAELPAQHSAVGPILGSVIAVGLVGLLAVQVRRRL